MLDKNTFTLKVEALFTKYSKYVLETNEKEILSKEIVDFKEFMLL
jgi:hypothetical protein